MTFVALLRGINVGGNNKIDMKLLKQALETAGLDKVETYINSGNVIFQDSRLSVDELVKLIENVIAENFLLNIRVLIRGLDNIKLICKNIPDVWTNDAEFKTDVMFLWQEADNTNILARLDPTPEVDNLKHLAGTVIWNIKREDYGRSSMNDLVGSKLYSQMTVRNVNTVRKLLELMNADDK